MNLFLILRKDLNNRFNNYIHNKTHKINSVLENGNLEKEKDVNKITKKNFKIKILCTGKLEIIKEINNNLNKKKKNQL